MKNCSLTYELLFKSFLIGIISLAAGPHLLAQHGDTVYAEIAAIDQPFMLNRLGAAQPTGMMFALMSDLVQKDSTKPLTTPGNARLRPEKRPRPIVLRANVGNVLIIKFTNLLAPYDSAGIVNVYHTNRPGTVTQSFIANSNGQEGMGDVQVTRKAGIHIKGMELAISETDDGSYAGNNRSSLARPGETKTYNLIVPEEGNFMLYSTGADVDNQQVITGAQLTDGLFGSINVQPPYAEWYRSQVSQKDLDLAINGYWRSSGTKVTLLPKASVHNIYDSSNTFPSINYDATYSSGPKKGWPILKMYDSVRPHYRQLVYTDLTAIITGPNHGRFPDSIKSESFTENPATPDRRQPFREFSIHYHELAYAVQAFPLFSTLSPYNSMLTPGLDQFAINYGTGGIAAEIYANRIGVGPMANCADCAYEEFFLSAWAVGDPAMVVDIPANATDNNEYARDTTLQNEFLGFETASSFNADVVPKLGYKATKVLYPDDPSNVYHSYMNDHCKFRVTHAGMGLPHVHHQHAEQWLNSPNSSESHYLDSKTIMPGSSYTLEMVHGSGNLNKTVGDQIFHCHFYPHFAAGMWSMWRVHDVLELGTEIDNNGRPTPGARALPDAEIKKGTLIPGLVPLPTQAMAPVPAKTAVDSTNGQVVILDTKKSPGYPFFIPGIAGTRAPNPPLDFAKDTIYNEHGSTGKIGAQDGGLPRGMILDAHVAFEQHTMYDWTKMIDQIKYIQLPDSGTRIEQIAMATHAKRDHPTVTPEGRLGNFILNGRPPAQGSPFADPAVDANGDPIPGKPRVYKAAVIQLDAVFNKKGWHYPQERMESLWDDVGSNISGTKAPEPLYIRANSTEVVEFWHTNLVPEYYELDDYQVRTPTDVIGQHIHLVKFDVTASDGAANGFNYEDGTLSPDVVRERIKAINSGGIHYSYDPAKYNPAKPLTATSQYSVVAVPLAPTYPNPHWGQHPNGQDWRGAQTTVQRWYADPLMNKKGPGAVDRTLTTVFTHDHFGPSTHQQVGLYAGLLIEPKGSTWRDASTGDTLGKRNDGGPTTWAANIIGADPKNSYREFMLEFQDNQQAYLPGSKSHISAPYPVNIEDTLNWMDSVNKNINNGKGGWADNAMAINPPGSCELVSAGGRGTFSLSYRNEPVPLRVSLPNGLQAQGDAGYLAYAFASIKRGDPAFNSQPVGGSRISDSNQFKYPVLPIGPGMNPTDPYTPLLRAYENDSIQIRTLVGAHVTTHYFNVHGVNWLFEPTYANSGYRSTQEMGLSEHFEMNFKLPSSHKNSSDSSFTDYLYKASSDMNGLTAGLWGLMRVYDTLQRKLVALPGNLKPISSARQTCGCPAKSMTREYHVAAINVSKFKTKNHIENLVFNKYDSIYDNTAMVYMLDEDLARFQNDPEYVIEPLVLRARAGECIKVTLTNRLLADSSLLYNSTTNYNCTDLQPIDLRASAIVGLHAELLSYDVGKSDGSAVGFNKKQTATIGDSVKYEWYAGKWVDGTAVPVEFGSVPLSAADPLNQSPSGLVGALIVEPENSRWNEDYYSRWSANIYDSKKGLLFREFVLQFQDNLSLLQQINSKNKTWKAMAINYKTEPLIPILNDVNPSAGGQFDFADISGYTSKRDTIKGLGRYPVTPHMYAGPGQPLRIRLINSGGSGPGEVFNLHGHVWQEEPYTNSGRKLGNNPKSQWLGFRDQLGALNSFDILIDKAGGNDSIPADYFYNSSTNQSLGFAQGVNGGFWGILTVKKDWIDVTKATIASNVSASISGMTYIRSGNAKITIKDAASNYTNTVAVDSAGEWSFPNVTYKSLDDLITFTTSSGGAYTTTLKEMPIIQPQKPVHRVENALINVRRHDFSRGVEPTTERSKKK